MGTRKAKKKMQRGAGSEKKKKGAVVELSSMSKPVGEVEVEEAVVQPKQVSARQERIINMIDALLGEEEGKEGKMEMLHCSLDSIDRLGDSYLHGQLRRSSQVSIM